MPSSSQLEGLTWAETALGAEPGEGKFYVKILDLEPDLSKFRLYFTSVTRVEAWPESLAEDLATRFDGIMRWSDFLPFWANLINAGTFAE